MGTGNHVSNADALEALDQDLRSALAHLYDPLYDAPSSLWALVRADPSPNGEAPGRGVRGDPIRGEGVRSPGLSLSPRIRSEWDRPHPFPAT